MKAVVVVAALIACASATCIQDYSLSKLKTPAEICDHIVTLTTCLGQDATSTQADTDLLNKEIEAHPECQLNVQPSITVKNRELRVVTEKDVIFNRFKRDSVGVFELKDDITDNSKDIADLQQSVADVDAKAAKVESNLTTMMNVKFDEFNRTNEVRYSVMQDFLSSAAKSDDGVSPVWLHYGVGKFAYGTKSPIRIFGRRFSEFYDPATADFIPVFQCVFTRNTQRLSSMGYVVMESPNLYVVHCTTPLINNGDNEYTLSLYSADDVEVPFKGLGDNKINFDTVHNGVRASGSNVIVSFGTGMIGGTYQCSFKTNTSAAVKITGVLSNDKRSLTCGTPTMKQLGVSSSTKAYVSVAVTRDGTAIPVSGSATADDWVWLDFCSNGRADNTATGGWETDVDCGGMCGGCDKNKACSSHDDCASPYKCFELVKNQRKCQLNGNGKASSTPGQSCKQIKRDYPFSANGVYWIKGFNYGLSDPTRVYCWMADRDGGGWTLGLKHQYHNSVSLGAGAMNPNNVVRSDLLTTRNGWTYKLDDKIIRALINQTDAQTSATKFDILVDQVGINSYYSGSNREYVIVRNYEAWWTFGSVMKDSKAWDQSSHNPNSTWVESYMQNNFNGITPIGDGSLNWKGKTTCGNPHSGRKGLFCSSQNALGGTVVGNDRPNGGPYGGRGCVRNLGYNRWAGNPHVCMYEHNRDTYLYMCNGPQHSSSYNMAHRWWFRPSYEVEEP